MRIAILTSTLGFGHLRAAQAVEQALREREPHATVELVDVWSLVDPTVAAAAREGYLRAVVEQPMHYEYLFRFSPQQWRAFFRDPQLPTAIRTIIRETLDRWFPGRGGFPTRGGNLDQTLFLNLFESISGRTVLHGNLVRRALVVWMHVLLCRRLRQHLLRFDADLVVSTQMMPAALLSTLKKRGELADLPIVAVLTDYGVHDFWLRPNIDHYCVATADMATDLRLRGVTDAPIAVTGIPLMADFREPVPQQIARARLGLPDDITTILITGGGYGIGAADAAEFLLRAGDGCQSLQDCRILLAAGQDRVDARLQQLADKRPDRISLYQRDVDMPLLIRASDVVIGKPGGLSVSEALACGRPFLAICSLGGQESFNVTYLERHDVGARVDGDAMYQTLASWLADRSELSLRQERAWDLGHRRSSERVAESIQRVLARAGRGAKRGGQQP